MNREFKFRIWDSTKKKWIKYGGNDTVYQSEYYIDVNGGVRELYYDSLEAVDDNAILQQYTGINDKNGKEIYEGDIVKFSYYLHEHDIETIVGEVFFKGGIYYFNRDLLMATNDGNFIEESLEVVGNMFENPKLLK